MTSGANRIISILLAFPAILIAITAHEAARALISTLLGDELPRREGRLTLNPLKHFEPIGFLLLYATGLPYGASLQMNAARVGVGWGAPVSTNSRYYKNRRTGVVLTSVGPSIVNFLLAVLFVNILSRAGSIHVFAADFLLIAAHYNICLVVCNFLPVAPFDCLKIILEFTSKRNYFSISQSESVMQLIMLLLLLSGLLSVVMRPIYIVVLTMVEMLII